MRVPSLLRRAVSWAASFRLLVLGLVWIALSPPASQADAPPSAIHHGRWTKSHSTEHTAIHLILLPNPNSWGPASKILMWQESHVGDGEGEFGGKVWSWTPAVQDSCLEYPTANIVEEDELTEPAYAIFCAGHSPLPESGGKLLVVGGHEFGEAGANRSVIFDPSDNSWSDTTSLHSFRWYASVVQLGGTGAGEGGQAVFSGSSYHHLWAFGGKESNGTYHDEVNRFGANLNGVWDPAIDDFTGTPGGGDRPEARTGHAATASMHIFGGRGANGTTLYNDHWVLLAHEDPSGGEWIYDWEKRVTTSESPKGRHRATATIPFGDRNRERVAD